MSTNRSKAVIVVHNDGDFPGFAPGTAPRVEIVTTDAPCGETFYNCQDSTDGAPHCCDLPNHPTGQSHHCKCGAWGDC